MKHSHSLILFVLMITTGCSTPIKQENNNNTPVLTDKRAKFISHSSAYIPPVEKPVYTGPEPINVLGPIEDAFRSAVKRWSQEMDWNVKERYALKYGVLLNGKSLKEDLMTLSAAVERDDFHLLFDRYKNGVVVITQSGVTPRQSGETPVGIAPPSATGVGAP